VQFHGLVFAVVFQDLWETVVQHLDPSNLFPETTSSATTTKVAPPPASSSAKLVALFIAEDKNFSWINLSYTNQDRP